MFEKAFKDFKIQFEDRQFYLYAFVSGSKDSLEISNLYWSEIVNECKKRKCNKILIVEKFENQLSTIDMYNSGKHIAEVLQGNTIRVAFVDKELTHDDLNAFGEKVAQNRGATGGIFSTIEEAEAWLSDN